MANVVLTPSLISKETLVMLSNNMVAASKVNRQFEDQFVKIGTTLTIRKPNRFKVVSGPGLQVQDVVEPSTSITISNQKHVDFQFSSVELTLAIEEFSERYLKPAAEQLANAIDYDVISNWTQVFNVVGTPGTLPSTFRDLANVGQRLDESAAPQETRVLMNDPATYWSLADGLKGFYVQSVAEPALKGFLAKVANFEIYMDQNIQKFQTLSGAGSPATGQVVTAGQTGSQITVNGFTAGATVATVGSVFTIAGVYAVNPNNRQTTGSLQNFVVTSPAVADATGQAVINIYPPITPTGAYQTVTASPAAGAVVTFTFSGANGQYTQNLAFVRDAFGLVTVPLEMPEGVDFKARELYKGISLRIIRAWDINSDTFPCRTDVLYGTTTFYPELAVRLTA